MIATPGHPPQGTREISGDQPIRATGVLTGRE
jgi:hypothetical protein